MHIRLRLRGFPGLDPDTFNKGGNFFVQAFNGEDRDLIDAKIGKNYPDNLSKFLNSLIDTNLLKISFKVVNDDVETYDEQLPNLIVNMAINENEVSFKTNEQDFVKQLVDLCKRAKVEVPYWVVPKLGAGAKDNFYRGYAKRNLLQPSTRASALAASSPLCLSDKTAPGGASAGASEIGASEIGASEIMKAKAPKFKI